MAQLTQKELLLLQDNICMCNDTAEYLQACVNTVSDPQLKNICQQMIQDHKQGAQILSRHIHQTNVQ